MWISRTVFLGDMSRWIFHVQASSYSLQVRGILRKNIFKIKKSIFRIVLAGTVLIATLLNPLSPGKAGIYLPQKEKKD
jgi:hypothetical protein